MAPSEPTALALLDAYLKLCVTDPATSVWSDEAFIHSPVSAAYYRRVQALAKAVDFPLNILINGEGWGSKQFFRDRGTNGHAPFIQEIEAYLAEPGQEGVSFYERGQPPVPAEYESKRKRGIEEDFVRDLDTIFHEQLRFVRELHRFQHFNGRWFMSSSAGAQFSIRTTSAVIASLDQPAIERIRQFLARLIDPAGRTYSEAELVERFDYPTSSITELEADNF